eukprot:CAMPEP_0184076020 /NCGR_PEP_ID=MMETSP0957-20130417/71446_1 /TAXON_ID=627963 /ORGANISM="Aplanochytrium sp, Strain PBS07" /LENGTH=340 /DNA_ID=CAMNT_0026378511 /DNA_START=117 /DNA_END=1140 /DNA_ORIENTATION=+
MEVVKQKKVLDGIQSTLSEIEEKVQNGTSTADDARKALQFRTDLNGKIGEAIGRLEKRAGRKDPVSGEPMYKPKFIKSVSELSNLRTELLNRAVDVHNEIGDLVDKERAALAEEAERQRIAKEEEEQRRQDELVKAEIELKKKKQEEEERIQKARKQELEEAAGRENSEGPQKELEEAAKAIASKMTDRERYIEMERARLEAFGSVTGKDALEDALGMVRTSVIDNSSPQAHLRLLHVLREYFHNIVKLPDRKAFRRINVENPKFRSDVLSISGGCEVLLAAGFKFSLEDHVDEETNAMIQKIFYVLDEPPLEELDAWSDWYQLQKFFMDRISKEIELSK